MKKVFMLAIFCFMANVVNAEVFNVEVAEITLPEGYNQSFLKKSEKGRVIYGFSKPNVKKDFNSTLIVSIYDYSNNRPTIKKYELKNMTDSYLNSMLDSLSNIYKNMEKSKPREINISTLYALESHISGVTNGVEFDGKVKLLIFDEFVVSFMLMDKKNKKKEIHDLDDSINGMKFKFNKKINNDNTRPIWKIFLDS
jgi:hypothetical protein